jgi:hypothetical protein
MNSKTIIIGAGLLATLVSARTTNINIPDGDFQNVNAIMNYPKSGDIGAWSAAFTGLNLGGQMRAANASANGWPAPPSGAYALEITMPLVGVGPGAAISEALTNQLQPNSVYTLSVALDPQAGVDLVGGASLSLYAVGSTNLASVGGTDLVNLLGSSPGYQTISLTYKTGNTVPASAVGISFAANSVANVSGSLYVDDFQLSVNPVQVQLNPSVPIRHQGSQTTVTVSGSGGAPGATYQIQSITNLVQANSWALMTTNQFDTNGNFSQTITIDPNIPYKFFRVVVP